MPAPDALADIAAVLTAFAPASLRASSLTLLAALGYRSDRTLPIPGAPDPAAFRRLAEAASGKTLHAEKAKFAEWNQADLLFQLTDTEVRSAQPLFPDVALAPGLLESALFFAIELRGAGYSRTALADVTRQINRLFPMPVVVLFSYAGRLSLAVVHRRQHRRAPSRDVLGRVSLIRDIDTRHPHRAHLDILHALSLPERIAWLDARKQPRSFDGLLAALLAALDTEALNKRFYTALFAWFTRAVSEATFPTKQARTLAPEEHVIRLITRLLFVWFVKEKGLIAAELFTEAQVAGLLKDYDRDTGDSYYRAVVQNLFFATLNTEIAKRGFSRGNPATHRDFSRYRYRREMQDPAALLALFRRTPFINGGLFDCLDSETAPTDGGWRIDCFTDTVTDPKRREHGLLSIPNRLFFDAGGLITLFDRFTFTVEENTPAEQDVALDPELLGKVFENLLAAVTPETRETARKQTGSYYTPRAVVDYMVDEALVAALADRVQPADGDAAFWQARLHYLLDYADAFADADELFTETERDGVVRAIADTTVLDPAVGSGAFPMGVLHKLTLALRRLDPDNRRWEALQKARARARMNEALETRDRGERDAELLDISATFERYRDSDFGRKLYLIQNSIFGVDIQPVASQIAKLRFFISLAIEQEPTADEAANYGIKPLPNLETRFVAANTLLGLDKPAQQTLGRTARGPVGTRAAREPRAAFPCDHAPHENDVPEARRQAAHGVGGGVTHGRLSRGGRGQDRAVGPVRSECVRGLVRRRVHVRADDRLRRGARQSAVRAVAEERRCLGPAVQGCGVRDLRPHWRPLSVVLRTGVPPVGAGHGLAGLHHVQQLAEGGIRQGHAPLCDGQAGGAACVGNGQGRVRERDCGYQRVDCAQRHERRCRQGRRYGPLGRQGLSACRALVGAVRPAGGKTVERAVGHGTGRDGQDGNRGNAVERMGRFHQLWHKDWL